MTVSVLLALVAAFLFACGSAAQQSEAAQVEAGEPLMSELLHSPRWWLGIVGDIGGYLFQAAALAVGSVLVVQPLIVTTLLFALPISAILTRARVGRITWVLAAVLAAALAVFLVVGDPTDGLPDAPGADWLWPLVAMAIVTACSVVIGFIPALRGSLRALAFGVATGVLFAVTTVLTKPVLTSFEHAGLGDNLLRLLTDWRLYVLAACGIGAMYLQQRAFQLGPISASLPAITVGEPVGAAVLGGVVLDESVVLTGVRGVLVIASVVAMIATSVVLARRSPAPSAPGQENGVPNCAPPACNPDV
ncbi:DMT family transporter [Tsukamurella soli]